MAQLSLDISLDAPICTDVFFVDFSELQLLGCCYCVCDANINTPLNFHFTNRTKYKGTAKKHPKECELPARY